MSKVASKKSAVKQGPVDGDTMKRAISAYWKYCQRNGFIYAQPSRLDSYTEGGIVVLCNSKGEMYRYKPKPSMAKPVAKQSTNGCSEAEAEQAGSEAEGVRPDVG